MRSRSIFSAIITVAALSASADVLNVEVLDLDAPREEPPTVVPMWAHDAQIWCVSMILHDLHVLHGQNRPENFCVLCVFASLR